MNIEEFVAKTHEKHCTKAGVVTAEMISIFERKMKGISEDKSLFKDERHEMMDHLMCDMLESLGFSSGVEIFYSTDKWYA